MNWRKCIIHAVSLFENVIPTAKYGISYLDLLESAVDFCYSLLLGATHKEIVSKSLKKFKKLRNSIMKTGDDLDLRLFDSSHRLFIANPYSFYKSVSLE